jgi:hypothetical protein
MYHRDMAVVWTVLYVLVLGSKESVVHTAVVAVVHTPGMGPVEDRPPCSRPLPVVTGHRRTEDQSAGSALSLRYIGSDAGKCQPGKSGGRKVRAVLSHNYHSIGHTTGRSGLPCDVPRYCRACGAASRGQVRFGVAVTEECRGGRCLREIGMSLLLGIYPSTTVRVRRDVELVGEPEPRSVGEVVRQ